MMLFSSRILAVLASGICSVVVVSGGETIKIQQGDVEVDVQEMKDGGVEIDIMNNNNNNMFVQEDIDMESSDSCDKVEDCCSDADKETFMAIQLEIQVDHNFHEYGEYRLGLKDDDDDDDDSAAKLYWDEDDLETGKLYVETKCVARNGCYVFNIYGEDKAFEFDPEEDNVEDGTGYAKVYIDSGDGFKEKLDIDGKFDHEHVEFGCGCDDADDSCM